MASESSVYDIVIVGGGAAGLVLACRLSENPSLQVLVLEAGEDQTADPRVMVPAMSSTLFKTSSDWNLRTVPQAALGNREIYIPQGKMLGGSSALNSMLFTGCSKVVVDGWAQLGNPGWEWSAFSRSLEKSYTIAKAPPFIPKSGTEGPLKLKFSDECEGEWSKVWAETIKALGFPAAQDTLTFQSTGGLILPDTIDPVTAQRSYSASAYLAPVRDRANLTILVGVDVHKVLTDKSSDADVVATGVEYSDRDGTVKTVAARKEVIVSAGAFGSPKLLELSGVGDAGRLAQLGIDVVVDNPGVGENLQNHLMSSMTFQVRDAAPPTMDPLARQDPAALAAAMEAYAQQKGPLASSGATSTAQLPFPGIDTPEGKEDLEALLSALVSSPSTSSSSSFHAVHEAFVRSVLSSPSEASGYYFLGPAYGGYNPDGTEVKPAGSEDSYITILGLLTHPLSRGSVHVVAAPDADTSKSAGRGYKLAIDPKYLSNPLDIEVMARHIQFIEQRLASTEPLAGLLEPGGKRAEGAPEAGALADLERARVFLRDRAVGAHHYTGTCSMMPLEMGGVVDPQLRVYGTKNLRVCDASVIPLTPRANIQATVYGVAEHGAGIINASLAS